MRVLLCISLVLVLTGCRTPPPDPLPPPPPPRVVEVPRYLQPVTAALVEELNMYGAVNNFQYYLSNPLVLISAGSGVAHGANNRGVLELTSDFAQDIAIISANTRGEVIDFKQNTESKMLLELSFETGTANSRLNFTESESDGYFYLEVDNGTTLYGGRRYLVQDNAGSLAHLLIGIDNNMAPVVPRQLNGREITGDRVNMPTNFPISQPLVRSSDPGVEAPGAGQEVEQGDTENTDPNLRPLPRFPRNRSPYVMPSWPSPQPLYSIQVGAFICQENAQAAFDRLRAAGFWPVYERENEYLRVLVEGIAEKDLNSVTQRLRFAGFPDTWIR